MPYPRQAGEFPLIGTDTLGTATVVVGTAAGGGGGGIANTPGAGTATVGGAFAVGSLLAERDLPLFGGFLNGAGPGQ